MYRTYIPEKRVSSKLPPMTLSQRVDLKCTGTIAADCWDIDQPCRWWLIDVVPTYCHVIISANCNVDDRFVITTLVDTDLPNEYERWYYIVIIAVLTGREYMAGLIWRRNPEQDGWWYDWEKWIKELMSVYYILQLCSLNVDIP